MAEDITVDDNLKLTDICSVEILQKLQDSFFVLTGLSMGVSDPDGNEITKHQACHEFCSLYTKGSEIGRERCKRCDIEGTKLAREKGEPVIYNCHAGLTDFAAPIIVKGRLLGSFLGGQVLMRPMDEEKMRAYAKELGVDPDRYIWAANKIPIINRHELTKMANVLSTIANMISKMAYKRYEIQSASEEIVHEAKMKSDFLANMSHEIRTPMNAVIGMAEMALREDLPPAARDYVTQIKTASNSLLTIINDILDFSKIESGKMDIHLANYEPLSIINDITNIIMARIGDKKLELLVDFDPNIPHRLMGDSIRIKQIILNLANNAIKFTQEGKVVVRVGYERSEGHMVLLKVSVTDTGMGIKEEDLGKLFQSFQQVDSKRNRNIEGTGLGLAISKQLITLMEGKIGVESEYGKGSRFWFEIPQICLGDTEPSVKINDPRKITVGVLSDNPYVQEALSRDIERLGGRCLCFMMLDQMKELETRNAEFFFIDYPMFTDSVRKFVEEHPAVNCVLMEDYNTNSDIDISNLLIVKKPLYALNIGTIFNHEELYGGNQNETEVKIDFIAPDAKVLIVDDNELNLTVAAGLMEPLQMKIDKALSGKKAIEMIAEENYDLIFMDHMMPELDGVETTHVIRRFHQEYDNVPIIALTANAMEETRSMFLVEGMNDFIAKPIEMRILFQKIKEWLPEGKVIEVDPDEVMMQFAETQLDNAGTRLQELNATGELDVGMSLRLLGGEKLFWEVLKDYYKVIDKKAQMILDFFRKREWKQYQIEVHALKSASKQIGALALSEQALKLEMAAKDQDKEYILLHNNEMIRNYMHYKDVLAPYFEEEKESSEGLELIDGEELKRRFVEMEKAMGDLDMDAMENVISAMAGYAYPKEQVGLFSALREAVEEMDVDACELVIEQWRAIL